MSKLFTKKLGLTLIGSATALTLMACGGNGEETDTESNDMTEVETEGKSLTLGVWGGNDAEESSLDSLISQFEEETGAEIEKKVYTDYNTQIQTDLIGGTAPDVFYVDFAMFDFFEEQDTLMELDPELFEIDAFYETLVESFSNDEGGLYAIPKDMSTLSLYLNEDIFEAAGVSIDEVPGSLEEYVDWLPGFQEKIDEAYPDEDVFAMSYTPELSRTYHLMQRGDGDVITEDGMANLDDPTVIENLQILTDLKETGAYVTPQDVGTGWNGEAFGIGKIAIMDEGNWVYQTLNDEFSDVTFTVKEMPTYKGEPGSMMFSVGWGKYAGTEESELADLWIQHVTGAEGMQEWVEGTGTLPSRQDVAEAADITSNPDLNIHLEAWEFATPWQDGVTLTTVSNAFNNYLPTVMNGEETWEAAMEEANNQANSDIEAAN
ncbi:MAG: extracellular solute-binding protein [Alkalibacterium sp.]|uniref:sugar ABC transporter substrate-binding protein n=1 Tax=Alkalibacterium sp. TaxID=1872447 RepID=UPI003970CB54